MSERRAGAIAGGILVLAITAAGVSVPSVASAVDTYTFHSAVNVAEPGGVTTHPAAEGEVIVVAHLRLDAGGYASESYSSSTSADGTVTIPQLPAGTYDFALEPGAGNSLPRDTATAASTSTADLDGAFGMSSGSPLLMHPPRSISGRVLDASSNGLSGVTLHLAAYDQFTGAYQPLDDSATTDADGAFAFASLPGAQMTVDFENVPAPWAPQTRLFAAGYGTKTVTFQLWSALTISGQIYLRDASHPAAATDATVTYTDVSSRSQSALLYSDGSFSIELAWAARINGVLTVTPTDPTYLPVTIPISGDLPQSVVQNVTLTRLPVVSGQLTGAHGGLAGISVTVTRIGSGATVTGVTNASGSYRIVIADASDSVDHYAVSFSDPEARYQDAVWSGAPAGLGTALGMNDTLVANQQLAPVASVSGKITAAGFAASDFAAVDLQVEVEDQDSGTWSGDESALVHLGGDGKYDVTGVPLGTYRIHASFVGARGVGEYLSAPVALVAGDKVVLNFTLTLGGPKYGDIVRLTDGPALYLYDGPTHLVPIGSTSTLTDGGHSTKVAVVLPAAEYLPYVDSQPLSNLVICGSSSIVDIATRGALHPSWNLTSQVPGPFDGVWRTSLTTAACASFHSSKKQVLGAFLRHGTTIYAIESDTKYRILELPNATFYGAYYSEFGIGRQLTDASEGWQNAADVNAWFLEQVPSHPFPRVALGTLIRFDDSSTSYLEDSYSHLIPIDDTSFLRSALIPSRPVVRPASERDDWTIATAPLLPAMSCPVSSLAGGAGFIASNDWLWREDVRFIPHTNLAAAYCNSRFMYHSDYRPTKVLLVKRVGTSTVYAVGPDGELRRILTSAQARAVSGYVYVHTLGSHYFAQLTIAPGLYEPGALVRARGGTNVYLLDGDSGLIAAPPASLLHDAGISTQIAVLPQADLDARTIEPGQLTQIVTCLGATWIAGSGKLTQVDPALVSALPQAALDDATCTAIPRSSAQIAHALFIKSGSTTYQVIGTTKHKVLSSATEKRLQQTSKPVVVTVNSAFAASLTTGDPVYDAGMLLKGSGSQRYVLDGSGGRIPVRDSAAVSDLGLSTSVVKVSDSVLAGFAVQPAFSEFATCGATTYVAASGKLTPIDSAVAGTVPVSALPSSLCGVLTVGTAEASPVLLYDRSTHAVYEVAAGQKHKVANWSKAKKTHTALSVDHAFLGTIPSAASLTL